MNETRFLAKQLVIWTDEIITQNGNSKAIETAYPYLYRRYEYLKSTKIIASENAKKLFSKVFGSNLNLTKYDWNASLNPVIPGYSEPYKNNPIRFKKIKLRNILHWEHFDTAYDFKQHLLELKRNGSLNENEVYNRLINLKICWITKEENYELDKKFKRHRDNPKDAYFKCGIII